MVTEEHLVVDGPHLATTGDVAEEMLEWGPCLRENLELGSIVIVDEIVGV